MDERSAKQLYNEKEVYVYKCDCCGKQFDGFKVDNIISLNYGEFVPYKSLDDYGNDCGIHFELDEDLCEDCQHRFSV